MNARIARRPYPGTRPYRQTDRNRFFGRAADAVVVADWWRLNRLTYIVGPVGRGKTSLLAAAVRPLLAEQRLDTLPVGQLSYDAAFPAAAVPFHNPYVLALLRSWAPEETATRLFGQSVLDFVRQRTGKGVIFAAIDDADELLAISAARKGHRKCFLAELNEALESEPRLHLLVVGGEESVEVVAGTLGRGARYEISPLSAQSAIDAVREPLSGTGRSFAGDAAGKLVTDLQTSRIISKDGTETYITDDRIEPALLQVACAWLWDALPADAGPISVGDVRRFGDVDEALAAYCGQVIAQVADDHDLPPKRLASWLLGKLVTDLGTRGAAYEGATETEGMPNAVVRALAEKHLLVSSRRSGSRWYEILHDRLIEPLRQAVPGYPPARTGPELLRAAEHVLTIGELGLAERYAREILYLPPHGSDRRLKAQASSLLGNLACLRGEPEEAEPLYRAAAELYLAAGGGRAVAYQLAATGRTLLDRGRPADAVRELHAAVVRQPSDPVLQTELAEALWQDGQGQAAVAVLNDVLRMDGGDLAALQARGEILAYLGEARQAIRDLDRVGSQEQPSIRAARGLALAELGERPAALREIEDAVADGQRNGPVLLYAARAFAVSGDDGAAQEYAEQAVTATDPPLSPPQREAARQLVGRQ